LLRACRFPHSNSLLAEEIRFDLFKCKLSHLQKYVFWHIGNSAFKTTRGFIDSTNRHQSYLRTIIFSFNEKRCFSFRIITAMLPCCGPCPPLPSPSGSGDPAEQKQRDAPNSPSQKKKKPYARPKGAFP